MIDSKSPPTHLKARGTNIPLMKNKTDLINEIKKEIEKMNVQIDRKIIKGHPYTAEGKKHAKLLALLAEYK